MRHTFLPLATTAAVALTSCAPDTPREAPNAPSAFESDRISVTTRGSGPDILLIPGLASSATVWARVADSLEGRFRLHLVHVRGFAGAAAGANADGPVSAPVAEEIARYLREAKIERVAVVGHSMGASIGMMLASQDSTRVGRLMVADMVPYLGQAFAGPGATAAGVQEMAARMRDSIVAQVPGAPAGMLEQMFAVMARAPEARDTLLQHLARSDRRTVANAFHELLVTDLGPLLPRIRVPVTVLYVIPARASAPQDVLDAAPRRAFSGIPMATFVRIDDSEHFIQLDQPVRFAREIAAFMQVSVDEPERRP